MKKIELNTIASQNMTVVNEDVLTEVNGGCTFKYGTFAATCGGSYTGWRRVSSCSWHCPEGTVTFVKKWYAPSSVRTFYVSPVNPSSWDETNMWKVKWPGNDKGIIVCTRYGETADKIFKVN